jgi:hypothetical protein
MALQWSRLTALLFAIGLALGEAVVNWGDWQYAPLWIVDYLIVIWLVCAFFWTRQRRHCHSLTTAWAFTSGVFYMALFVWLDPERPREPGSEEGSVRVLLSLIALMLVIAVLGMATAAWADHQSGRSAANGKTP